MDDVAYMRLLQEEITLRLKEKLTNGPHEAVADLLLLKRALYQAVQRVAKSDETAPEEEKDVEFSEELLEKLKAEDVEAHGICVEMLKTFTSLLSIPDVEGSIPSGDRPANIKEDGSLPYSSSSINVFKVPISRRLETLTVLLFNFFLGIPLFIGTWIVLHFIPFFWPVMIIYDIHLAYQIMWPAPLPATGPRRTYFRNHACWRYLRDYFPVAFRVEDPTVFKKNGKVYNEDGSVAEADPEGAKNNYLFVCHPHGVHSFGAFVSFSTNACGVDNLFSELEISVQTLAIQFKLPFWRELTAFSGMGDSSRECLLKVLNGKPGHSATLVVGGAEEALHAAPGTSDLILNKRKGFVRIAMQTGAHLVPVFSFGETDVYRPIAKDDAKVQGILKKMQSTLGFAVPLFKGRGIFSYGIGVLPHRRRITTVVGKPMKVDKWDAKWDANCPDLKAKVDEVHKEYEKALVALYNRHKDVHDLARKSELRVVS